MNDFGLGPAYKDEQIVFGSQKPDPNNVQEWISFMKEHGIKRVCCLLSQHQLRYYNEYYNVDLLETYCKEFGRNNVCLAPVGDFHLADPVTLQKKILPFLSDANAKKERVVVHCSGGLGRTGHVLAAWLVFNYGFSPGDAIKAVEETGRNPCEAVYYGYATMEELYSLLHRCQKDNIV